MNELKVFEAFAGIGAVSKALRRQEIPFKLVGYSEIDKYASKSFAAIHGVPESLNLGDITKINENNKVFKNLDLFTYGFPCQDISSAGKMKGIGLTTRSGLLYDAMRIIQKNMPKYCIAENVKNLVSKRFINDFNTFISELEFYGYNNYWAVLNSLDYGVPQNRERVKIVSIRKDVDDGNFCFPAPIKQNKYLIDVLEPIVDSKYYLSDKMINCFENHEKLGNGFGYKPINTDAKYHSCLKASYYKLQTDCNYIITGGQYNQNSGFQPNENACTIDASCYKGLGCNQNRNAALLSGNIRRLIPLECFRLMDFDDEDFYKAKSAGISDTQLYKQAGNSIVVAVLEGIFKNLFKQDKLYE